MTISKKPLPGTKDTDVTDGSWDKPIQTVPNTPVFMQVQIGLFDRDRREALQDALKVVSDYWDSQPYSDDLMTGSFRFELDGHLFELHVSPLHPSGRGHS